MHAIIDEMSFPPTQHHSVGNSGYPNVKKPTPIKQTTLLRIFPPLSTARTTVLDAELRRRAVNVPDSVSAVFIITIALPAESLKGTRCGPLELLVAKPQA